MFIIYKHEIKQYFKNLLIWALSVGGLGFFCILLFSEMQTDMENLAESFAAMGAFSDAFGMSQLSIATIEGFFSTEVGTIHTLGGGMFAAIIATGILSKEEEGHTGEFLFSLPLSRGKVVAAKWSAVLSVVFLFNIFCVGLYVLGFFILGEEIAVKEFVMYQLMQFVMQIEIASVCFAVSACMKRSRLGIGLGVVLLLYGYDMIARVVPDLSDYKVISPFSYANAADIFSTGELETAALRIGIGILAVSIIIAFWVYEKRDLAS